MALQYAMPVSLKIYLHKNNFFSSLVLKHVHHWQ